MRRFTLLASLVLTTTVLAQQPKLTWIRYYQVQPGKDANILGISSKAALTRMVAEKKVAAWGVFVPLSHDDEPWTHALYVMANDWAAIDALLSAGTDLGATNLVPNGIRDTVIAHVVQSAVPPPAWKPKYLVVNLHPLKAGREGDAVTLFNDWATPIFNDLEKRSRVGRWGLSVQNIAIRDEGWSHMVWYFIPDLHALDEINDAWITLGPKLRAFLIRLNDMSTGQYRGQIFKVIQSSP